MCSNRKFINILIGNIRHITAYAESFKGITTPKVVWLFFLKIGIRGDV